MRSAPACPRLLLTGPWGWHNNGIERMNMSLLKILKLICLDRKRVDNRKSLERLLAIMRADKRAAPNPQSKEPE